MWTPSRRAGVIPGVTTRLSLGVADEQADAGRGGQTCLVRPNSVARTVMMIVKMQFDHEQSEIGNTRPVNPYSTTYWWKTE